MHNLIDEQATVCPALPLSRHAPSTMRLTVVAVLSCSASAWRGARPQPARRGAALRGTFVLPEDLSANDGLASLDAGADNGDYASKQYWDEYYGAQPELATFEWHGDYEDFAGCIADALPRDAAARAPAAGGAPAALAGFAVGCGIAERGLHQSFIEAWDRDAAGASQEEAAPGGAAAGCAAGGGGDDDDGAADSARSPACELYTGWLLAQAATAPLAVALASFLPCFWVYLWTGKRLLQQRADADARAGAGAKRPEPFDRWIDMYAGVDFERSVVAMLGIVEAVAGEAAHGGGDDARAQRRAAHAFRRGCELEFMFWDSAWRMEDWPGGP